MSLAAAVERFAGRDLSVRFEVSLDGKLQAAADAAVKASEARSRVVLRNPRLWWPNGWGEHPLYSVRATLRERGLPPRP